MVPDISSMRANLGLSGNSAMRSPRGLVSSQLSSIAVQQKKTSIFHMLKVPVVGNLWLIKLTNFTLQPTPRTSRKFPSTGATGIPIEVKN